MKWLLILFLCFGTVGCATYSSSMNKISLGMTKEQVIKELGPPHSSSAQKNNTYMNYSMYEPDSWMPTHYYVRLIDGKVESFGRAGDFDSTKDPTQVIKVIGDMKSEEKINIHTGNSELEHKLKTINKLLADGLITKNEFDEQKKKLLNEYISK